MDRVQILWVKIFLQHAHHKWHRAQKILLQRTTGKSHIGELAPMALCDIHVAGCGEHLPAWGLYDEVQGREANKRRHRLTEPTTKALCQPPPPPRPP